MCHVFNRPAGSRKNFLVLYPRNPLKSLDSGETMKGNERK